MLEAVPWENQTYGISGGGAAGNVAYGGTVNPLRNRKGGAGNPPPTGARASALPDTPAAGRDRVETSILSLGAGGRGHDVGWRRRQLDGSYTDRSGHVRNSRDRFVGRNAGRRA